MAQNNLITTDEGFSQSDNNKQHTTSLVNQREAIEIKESENNDEKKSEITKPIKIVVIGASGAGKSTICNLISNQYDTFKVYHGWNSGTTETKSYRFNYKIGDKIISFEVIDSPGFIHKKLPQTSKDILAIQNNMEQRWQDINDGVSVYLFLVPYVHEDIKYIDSVRFVLKYFSLSSFNRVYLVLSKCNGKTCQDMIENMKNNNNNNNNNDNEMSPLILTLLEKINYRCIASECPTPNDKLLRIEILKRVYYTHMHLCGNYDENNEMQKAFEKLGVEIANNEWYTDLYEKATEIIMRALPNLRYFMK